MLQRILELVGNKQGSIKELADAINISGNSITNWKNGHSASYSKYAPQIAEYYGVSLDWLSGNSDTKEQKETAVPNQDDGAKELIFIHRGLSGERRKQLEDYARYLEELERK